MTIGPHYQMIVVDDDLLYTRLVELVLKSLKYPGDLRIFNNPAELMPYLTVATPQPRPRLVLLDLNMPQMNGLSLLKDIRQNHKTHAIPTVMMSGVIDESQVRDAYLHGANTCVKKPDELDDFYKIFDRLIEYWFSLSLIPNS